MSYFLRITVHLNKKKIRIEKSELNDIILNEFNRNQKNIRSQTMKNMHLTQQPVEMVPGYTHKMFANSIRLK